MINGLPSPAKYSPRYWPRHLNANPGMVILILTPCKWYSVKNKQRDVGPIRYVILRTLWHWLSVANAYYSGRRENFVCLSACLSLYAIARERFEPLGPTLKFESWSIKNYFKLGLPSIRPAISIKTPLKLWTFRPQCFGEESSTHGDKSSTPSKCGIFVTGNIWK